MNKKGVTLIALAITLLVMIVITSTSIYFGFRALNKTSNFKVYSNLSLLYPKIEEYAEKHQFNPLEMKVKIESLGLSVSGSLWRFLTEEDLDNMNLPKKIKESGTNIFVNYGTKEIVYTKGYRKADGSFTYVYSEMRELERMSKDD